MDNIKEIIQHMTEDDIKELLYYVIKQDKAIIPQFYTRSMTDLDSDKWGELCYEIHNSEVAEKVDDLMIDYITDEDFIVSFESHYKR